VTAGHRGATETIKTLQHQYYWGSLAKDVRDYVRMCDACQRANSDRRRRARLFTPHAPPMTKWPEVSIDFLFELPETVSGITGLAVVVDKLAKQAHFLSLKRNFSAQDLDYVYIKEIYRHHCRPSMIISDRGARFTSKFWLTLNKLLGTKLNLSTAFHPETDRQPERTFGVFQEMIRPLLMSFNGTGTRISLSWSSRIITLPTILQAKRLFTLHPVNTLRLRQGGWRGCSVRHEYYSEVVVYGSSRSAGGV
jgi:Integrase zinc binding domain